MFSKDNIKNEVNIQWPYFFDENQINEVCQSVYDNGIAGGFDFNQETFESLVYNTAEEIATEIIKK